MSEELQKALGQIDEEFSFEVEMPSGNTEKMYYNLKEIPFKQINQAKKALIIWENNNANPPRTLPDMQKEFHEYADAVGLSLLFYVKDDKGNPIPYDGNINKHRPFEMLNHVKGIDDYDKITMVRNFFLGKFGVISTDFKSQFQDVTQLLLSSQMEGIKEVVRDAMKDKKMTKKQRDEMEVMISGLLENVLTNTAQQVSSEQSANNSGTESKKSGE